MTSRQAVPALHPAERTHRGFADCRHNILLSSFGIRESSGYTHVYELAPTVPFHEDAAANKRLSETTSGSSSKDGRRCNAIRSTKGKARSSERKSWRMRTTL